MNPITSFNIKADLKNHPLIYGSVALLALAAIAMSVAQPYISALRSINRYIFLGIGGGVIGGGLVGLRIRNCDGHYHFTQEQYERVVSVLVGNQKLPIKIKGKSKITIGFESTANDWVLKEFQSAIVPKFPMPSPKIIEQALASKNLMNTTAIPFSTDTEVRPLAEYLRPNEYIEYNHVNGTGFLINIVRVGKEPAKEMTHGERPANCKRISLDILRLRERNSKEALKQ